MIVWVDADACPAQIKEILFRAAERVRVRTVLKAFALNPRGTLYTPNNVQDHLARRNFMDALRSSGETTRGPPALNNTDIQSFANELDKFLTRQRA